MMFGIKCFVNFYNKEFAPNDFPALEFWRKTLALIYYFKLKRRNRFV